MSWRRQWHPTPVLLPGKSHGRRSLVAAVHGVAKSRTRLSDFTFTFHFHALEKEMATHSSVLAWRIPGTWEPGGLLSMGSHRVGHDWSNAAAAVMSTPQLLRFVWSIARALKETQKAGLGRRVDSQYTYHPMRMNQAGKRQYSLWYSHQDTPQ